MGVDANLLIVPNSNETQRRRNKGSPDSQKPVVDNLVGKSVRGLDSVNGLSKKIKPKKSVENKDEAAEKVRRADASVALIAENHELPAEKQLQIDYLMFLQDVLASIQDHTVELRSDGLRGQNFVPAWDGERAYDLDEYKKALGDGVNKFRSREGELVEKIISDDPERFLEAMVGRAMNAELHRMRLDKIPQTQEQLLELQNRYVELLIDRKLYDEAEQQIDMMLQKDFDSSIAEIKAKHFKANGVSREMGDAADQADDVVSAAKEDWIAKGMTESQIGIQREKLVALFYERNTRHTVAKHNLPLTGAKAKLFQQYVEMINPKDSVWTPSARRKDQYISILKENVPLVVLSAGTAVFVTRSLSLFAERFFLTTGSAMLRGVGANALVRTATSLSLEQSLGSVVYRGLGAGIFGREMYSDKMSFFTDLLVGLAGRGLFKVGGVALQAPKEAVAACFKTIKDVVPKIVNQPLKNLINRLVATNNQPAAVAVTYAAERRGLLPELSAETRDIIRNQFADLVVDTADSLRIDATVSSAAR